MKRTIAPGLAGEGGEVQDLVVVAPAQQHDVDLDRAEAGRLGRVHGGEHRGELAAPADRAEPFGPQ